MILDTTFVIDLLRGKKNAEKKAKELENSDETVIVPTPVVFELFAGIVQSDAPMSERRKIEEFTKAYAHTDLGYTEAKEAGEILGRLLLEGKRIGIIDTLIAGFAIKRGETILTRNPDHFERIEGITTETY